jgi:hypothetical protein
MVQDAKPVGLDGTRVCFDDERAVCDAGVMLVATLAERLGRRSTCVRGAADQIPRPSCSVSWASRAGTAAFWDGGLGSRSYDVVMRGDIGAATVMPRWLRAVWLWMPALAALVLFGAIAVLQLRSGFAAWWWALAAVACAGAYGVRERRPVAALAVSLLVVAAVRMPGLSVLSSRFDVAYLLLLFVPVLPLVAVASARAPRWSSVALGVTGLVTVAVSPDPVWSTST